MDTHETRIAKHYRITELLGSGSMGRVYRAHHDGLGIDVAVKTSGAQRAPRDGTHRVERFRREALAMAKLRHTNILQLMAYGEDDTHGHYLVTEYVSGGTLATLVDTPEAKDSLTIPVIADLLAQVASGMAQAHDQGIVHRDLKPCNLLLGKDKSRVSGFKVKIADFGVAAVGREHVTHKLTLQGTVIGTPEYMSPEQANGERIDERSDVYALGMMLFELVTGRPPFTGNVMQVILEHIGKPAPELPVDAEAHGELASLYAQMVDKKAAQRPSMAQVSECLVRLYGAKRRSFSTPAIAAAAAVVAVAATTCFLAL